MSSQLYQMEAAGNSFSALSGTEVFGLSAPHLAKALCSKFNTDGFFILNADTHKKNELSWDFFNRDGSPAEMCGNAARCAGLMGKELGWVEKNYTLKTKAGLVSGSIESDGIEVSFAWPLMKALDKQKILELTNEFAFIDSGVPHLIVEDEVKENEERFQLSKALRSHPSLGEKGSNVTWVELVNHDHLRAVTFERGVENFTAACGTGAVAAAFWAYGRDSKIGRFSVTMPGGLLEVRFDSNAKKAYLKGPTKMISKVEVDLGAISESI